MDLLETLWDWSEDVASAIGLSTTFFLLTVGILLICLIFVLVGIRHRWANVISLLGCLFLTGIGIYQIYVFGDFQDFVQGGFFPFWILSVVLLLLSLIFLFRKRKPAAADTQTKTDGQEVAAFTHATQAERPAERPGSAVSESAATHSSAPKPHLSLYDSVVHKKDWKKFRRRATQDELTVLAIGSRYRLKGATFYVKSVLSVVGTIASITLGLLYLQDTFQFALFVMIGGYLFFNLLASKQLGYADTLRSCNTKLDKEHRDIVKSLFPENILLAALRQIVLLCLNIFTIPYQFLLLIIETFIPPARNWAVKHGGSEGAVITLPKGYDIGNLGALGEYYASASFAGAWEEQLANEERARTEKFSSYTYTDKYGVTQTAYSDDGKNFYTSTDKLTQVGTSEDGGKTIDLKN